MLKQLFTFQWRVDGEVICDRDLKNSTLIPSLDIGLVTKMFCAKENKEEKDPIEC